MWRWLSGLVLIAVLSIVAVHFKMQQMVQQPLAISHTQLFTLNKGSSYSSLLRHAEQQQWIASSWPYKLYGKLNPGVTRVKAGTYQLSPELSFEQLLTMLVSGKEYQFKITFVEGTTFKEWLALLANNPHLEQTITAKNWLQLQPHFPDVTHPEGMFFPDTYKFTKGTSDLSILQQANQRMRQELADSWQQRAEDLPYESPYQALIMASIIEKETAVLAEQPLISAVFVNRLRKGMRLQTDPTIIYGLGERYTGDITYANIREKTAYNTYQINGLPPTPIAMPGKTALDASVNPASSDYLYFVSKGNGEHIFSKNLADHNRAVDKYQRGKP
ncbi:endolytic transglycosylase MltG [Thalassotalea mangrovi]|uniref:Endolytic murein transglycosylase n=1 Tax=Thalassotalea mangrovi TaxID=2572245 RepID=A0A4U1B652_9GAMM|nr:endolytic transglycosylase MltG [Thalassotalea mangrovi]TKB45896.1 endolytic transglycosylase MltG [Thalassotalea mangrovi]